MNILKGKNKMYSIFLIVMAAIISVGIYFLLIGNMKDVVVVNQTIRGGTKITEEMLTVQKMDKTTLPDGWISKSDKKEVIGKYLDLGLTNGSVLTEANLSLHGKASLIESGKILYSMKDLETYPQGLVTGDKLNIVVASSIQGSNYVKTIENVPVANIHMTDGEISGLEVYVTPEESQLISFAMNNGDVSIGLLPIDYEEKNIPVLDINGFITATKDAK